MKQKVFIKYHSPSSRLANIPKGDWIDLRAAAAVEAKKGDFKLISLGVSMDLPPGCEAIVAPRSSSPINYGFIVPNSIGVIDNSYRGTSDVWKCPALFFTDGKINKGDRICQFRIQLSQKATVWQKLKWLFSDGFVFIEVDYLQEEDRGGFGSTGRSIVTC